MENNRFFNLDNNRYMVDQNCLYIAKDEGYTKCHDVEYYEFFLKLLNSHVTNEKALF